VYISVNVDVINGYNSYNSVCFRGKVIDLLQIFKQQNNVCSNSCFHYCDAPLNIVVIYQWNNILYLIIGQYVWCNVGLFRTVALVTISKSHGIYLNYCFVCINIKMFPFVVPSACPTITGCAICDVDPAVCTVCDSGYTLDGNTCTGKFIVALINLMIIKRAYN